MSDSLADLLDLRLAFRRVQRENFEGGVFIRHPHELLLIEQDLDQWIQGLDRKIRAGEYHPGSLGICDVPKAKAGIRPGGSLSIEDQVVYAACVGAFLDKIKTSGSVGYKADYSYELMVAGKKGQWYRYPIESWLEFNRRSLEQLDGGSAYVVFADISAYYEYVDHGLLQSQLRSLGVERVLRDQISSLLGRWSQTLVRGRGLPQGFAASNVLSKLYLSTVDQDLWEQNWLHHRYADDFRIFCKDLADAKSAVVCLAQSLRRKGLVAQSSKSVILRVDAARQEIQGVQPIISPLETQFKADVGSALGLAGTYFSLPDAERLLQNSDDDTPLEVIRRAYQAHFLDGGGEFRKTLFRWLIGKLAVHKDRSAIDHCLVLLRTNPEETQTILRYIERADAVEIAEPAILRYLESPEAVYDYQGYQIIEWRCRMRPVPSLTFKRYVRQRMASGAPPYLIAVCREFMGLFGSTTDHDRLIYEFPSAFNDLQKAEILCAIRSMEPQRRNGFLASVEEDGVFTGRAVQFIKGVVPKSSDSPHLVLLK
jgi:hypothetical protein